MAKEFIKGCKEAFGVTLIPFYGGYMLAKSTSEEVEKHLSGSFPGKQFWYKSMGYLISALGISIASIELGYPEYILGSIGTNVLSGLYCYEKMNPFK